MLKRTLKIYRAVEVNKQHTECIHRKADIYAITWIKNNDGECFTQDSMGFTKPKIKENINYLHKKYNAWI